MLRSARLLALALLTLAAAPAVAGPPWISIEYPANPHDQRTRDAFLVVNTFHHGTPSAMPLRGTAEGIVRGERRTVTLRFGPTERTASFALTRQWPQDGRWVLNISLAPEESGTIEASVLVVLGTDGTPSRVTVPTRRDGQWSVPRAVTADEVLAALRDAGEQRR